MYVHRYQGYYYVLTCRNHRSVVPFLICEKDESVLMQICRDVDFMETGQPGDVLEMCIVRYADTGSSYLDSLDNNAELVYRFTYTIGDPDSTPEGVQFSEYEYKGVVMVSTPHIRLPVSKLK